MSNPETLSAVERAKKALSSMADKKPLAGKPPRDLILAAMRVFRESKPSAQATASVNGQWSAALGFADKSQWREALWAFERGASAIRGR